MGLPRIAIIGAGPSGLMLARLLQHHGLDCAVFDLDQDRHVRGQAGMLDLHADMGQLAFREAGLLEELMTHSIQGAEAIKLVRADGSVPWDENGTVTDSSPRNRPEFDRTELRNILIDSLKPGAVQWGRKLMSAEPSNEPKKFDLHFENSVEKGFDLVVGADGAWSKIRPLVTKEKPFYSGVVLVDILAKDVKTQNPWLSDYAGAGSMFMFDEGRIIICQRNRDNLRSYAGVRQPENWVEKCGIDWTQHDSARQALIEQYFGGCHADLKRIIAESTDGLVPRKLYMLPVGLEWAPRSGVTLLGDAAHLMTPFAGVGVNVALADALDLAQALIKRKAAFDSDVSGNVDAALVEYEKSMFVRAKLNMGKSNMGLKNHFTAGGVDRLMGLLEGKNTNA